MASVSYFWKRKDGRWRLTVALLIVFFLSDVIYDFAKEGWRSWSAIKSLLLAASIIALAPLDDESREGRIQWRLLSHSPRYAAGAIAFMIALGILLLGVGRDFKLW